MNERPRRLRCTDSLRRMVRETRLSKDALVLPFFVQEGRGIKTEIPSLAGQYRYSPDNIAQAAQEAYEAGVKSFLLFGIPEHKDNEGSGAWAEDGAVQQAVREIKRHLPESTVITDVCLCEYTSHGHCGIPGIGGVDNDLTLPLLAKAALSHAQAGADIIAPSDMMDGRIAAIRSTLDNRGYTHLPIMSYSAKYASAFYGPFRDAAGSAPGYGDRKGYQMDYHNTDEAMRENRLDCEEGADILMVKPALSYLDVIYRTSQLTDRPLAAYSVSGEYAMIKAAAAQGYLDEYSAFCEATTSIFRAGADILITYWATEAAKAIIKGDIG